MPKTTTNQDMWFLNAHTAELKFFSGPDHVPGGYTILSHVWGKAEEEDTFQKVKEAYDECQRGSRKIVDATLSHNVSGDPRDGVISSLSADVKVLVAQVHNLTTRLQELVAALQQRDPTLASLLLSETVHNHPTQCDAPTNSNADIVTASLPKNARDCLSEKIRRFLIQSEQDGFDWAWADTCCIDKTSSAELTEAINSMFGYYSRSEICYAYLGDVPPSCDAQSREFRQSRWHKRGWTLQELIAPKDVTFVREDWSRLGTKYELADVLQSISNMPPASVLRFEKDISEMSVGQRMSWAARRNTTRIEDEAYCLFGLFDVNMPTLYGEGRNAFYRLQEVIMSTSPDTSLFAWSVPHDRLSLEGIVPCGKYDLTGRTPRILGWRAQQTHLDLNSACPPHLLAPSPHHFQHTGRIVSSIKRRGLSTEDAVSDDYRAPHWYIDLNSHCYRNPITELLCHSQ